MRRPSPASTLIVLAVALLAAAGCGSRKVGTKGPGGGSEVGDPDDDDDDTVPTQRARKISIVWVVEPGGAGNRIGLALTNETGAVTNEPVTELAGTCTRGLGQDPDAAQIGTLLAIGCKDGDDLRVLRVVRRASELVVMRGSADPDTGELWFEEQTRVVVPSDAMVVAGE
jgi:hypothetical protein